MNGIPVRALIEAGLVEVVDEQFRVSQAGLSLSNASAAKPLKRSTAEQRITELVDRAKAINADDRYAYYVERVVLFGSMLDPATEKPSDIDIAVALSERPGVDPRNVIKRAYAEGRSFSTFLDKLAWPEEEVLRTLKNRSRAISLHSFDQLKQLGIEGRTLYEREQQ